AVVAALARQRPGLAEGRDAQRDETRIAPLERLRRKPGRLEAPRAQILDQRVGGGEQAGQPRLRRERVERGLDRALASVLGREGERALAGESGAAPAHRRAFGRLELDDGGAEIGKQTTRHLTGGRAGQLEDYEACERAAARGVHRHDWLAHGRLTPARRYAPRCRRAPF